jgi:hypothetical protein
MYIRVFLFLAGILGISPLEILITTKTIFALTKFIGIYIICLKLKMFNIYICEFEDSLKKSWAILLTGILENRLRWVSPVFFPKPRKYLM